MAGESFGKKEEGLGGEGREPGGGGNVTLSQGDASLQDGHPVGPGLTPEVRPLLWAGASEGPPLEPRGGVGAAEHQGAPPTAAGGVATGGGGWGRGQGRPRSHCSVDSFSKRGIFLFFCFQFLFFF